MRKCLPNPLSKKIINLRLKKDQKKNFLRKESGISKHWITLLNLIRTGADQTLFIREKVMNLKRSPFSILDKDKREMDYIKGVYKRKIQAEIESYKDPEDDDKRDTIQAQDVLMLDRISI